VDILNRLYLPGAVALWCAALFALSTIWGYSRVLAGDRGSLVFARRAYGFLALSTGLAAAILILLLIIRDFRVEYVFQYSGLDLPMRYQFASFWAGQKGSFMIWLVWGVLLGLLVRRTAGAQEPSVMLVYTLTLCGLLWILLRESPFLLLTAAPADGQGLNPLLQNNWMVIHPPIMFIGYATAAVPFAFAMSALWRRDYDGWAARAFPWALAGFLVLGCAILMGGYWAYETLGWGGYWGWDPVENASLIPWLFGTALVHGLHMERTKGRFRRVNYVLAALVYLSVLYGTFLTRSGVLADFSVHSFVDLGITGPLLVLLIGFLLLAVTLLIWRLRRVPTAENADPVLSRGTFMMLAVIVVLVAAVVISVGTSAPLLTKVLPKSGQVGPSFYNEVNFPLACLVAFLLSLVPVLTWRGEESFGGVLRKLRLPAIASALITAGAAIAVHNPFHLLFVFLSAMALTSNLAKTIEKVRATGMSGLRATGGYLAHVGVGVIFLGILASSAYDRSAKITLPQGKPKKLEDMTLTFTRFLPRQGFLKERMEIEVVNDKGKRFFVYPKMFVNDRTRQLMVNPDILSTVFQDFYVSPIEYVPSETELLLARGEARTLGENEIRFVNFDLQAGGTNAFAQMQSGGPVTIGATVEVKQGGHVSRVTPIYRLDPKTGVAEAPPLALPGGGVMTVAGIDASSGKVRLDFAGASPALLSIDVTHKPLIQLVWFGLFIVLGGGGLATLNRLRESMIREKVAAGRPTAPTPRPAPTRSEGPI